MGHGAGLIETESHPPFRHRNAETREHMAKAFAVFSVHDRLMRGPQQRYAFRVQAPRQFQRCLTAELSEDAQQIAILRFTPHDRFDVFMGKGFEVETVRGVEIRTDRFGIAVDENGFHPSSANGLHGLHAAAVELHALSDAIGPAAQHDGLFAIRWRCLISAIFTLLAILPGGIQVRRFRFEFSGTSVHALEDRMDAQVVAAGLHRSIRAAAAGRDLPIAEPRALGLLQQFSW